MSSIKFTRSTSNPTRLELSDINASKFPNSDWAVGIIASFGADISASSSQCLFRTGEYQWSGNLILMWTSAGATTAPGKFYLQFNGEAASKCYSPVAVEANKSYLIVVQRQSGAVTLKMCPILTTAPTNGAAVLSSAPSALGVALDGLKPFWIGNRELANNGFNHNIGRTFRVERALTDFEIAKLAHGREIGEFASPTFYVRMNDSTDTNDLGSMANTVTAAGPLTTGPDLGFGYSSVPTAPTMVGTPAVVGSPLVGTAVSYTPAATTGNPPPTTAQQWTINGVDVANATSATYTPVALDAGKLLRVRQTASNGVNPAVSATSDGVVVSSTAVSLTFTEQLAEWIFQVESGAAIVPWDGAYTGTAPTKIEYQLYDPNGSTVVKAWADIGATIGGGTWSASPAIPEPKLLTVPGRRKYLIQFRSKNSGGNVVVTSPVSVNRFGVGDRIIAIGSSSPATWINSSGSGYSSIIDHDATSTYIDGVFQQFGTSGKGGQMATYISEQLSRPIAMINCAAGGTSLADWQSGAGGSFNIFTNMLAAIGPKLGGVWAAAGSNDITSAAAAPTVAAHLTKIQTLIANVRAACGQPSLPILWSGINRRVDALYLQASNAHMAENAIGDEAGIIHVQTMHFPADGVHLTGTGYGQACSDMQYVWVEHIKGTKKRGPKITSAAYTGSVVTLTIAHRSGTDITPISGNTGFVVTDDSGTPSIVSVERVDATHIRITCNRALVNAKVSHFEGNDPVATAPTLDNGVMPLPLAMLAPMAATSTEGAADTAAPTFTGTVSITSITASGSVVSWGTASDNVGVTGYEISVDTGTPAYTPLGNVQTRNVTGLAGGTSYTVRVRAHDAAGNKSLPITATFTTLAGADTTAPSLAGVISISGLSTDAFNLSCDVATDNVAVVGYEISVDTGTASYSAIGSTPNYYVTGLTASTTYTVRARAYDAAGNRSAALTKTVTTLSNTLSASVPEVERNVLDALILVPALLTSTALPLPYKPQFAQELVMYNKSASTVVVNIKGALAGIYSIPRAGGKTIDLSLGLSINVPANSFSTVVLNKAKQYLQGNITISAATDNVVSAVLVK